MCLWGASKTLMIPQNHIKPSHPSISSFPLPRSTLQIQPPWRDLHVPTPYIFKPNSRIFSSLSFSRGKRVRKSQPARKLWKHSQFILSITMATIKVVKARQIFDSRGNPTVEVSFNFFFYNLFVVSVWSLRKCVVKKKKREKIHTLFLALERKFWHRIFGSGLCEAMISECGLLLLGWCYS